MEAGDVGKSQSAVAFVRRFVRRLSKNRVEMWG